MITSLFPTPMPVIGVVHLLPLPGSPRHRGDMAHVIGEARRAVDIFERHGVDGVIVENFFDVPFFIDDVPPVTVAAMSAVAHEVITHTALPVGINVLRNDGVAAVSIAAAVGARFVRINVLGRPVVSEQGIIAGNAGEVMRLRAGLAPDVLVFADAAVKHASPMVPVTLSTEIHELTERCGADVIVVSGDRTGMPTDPHVVAQARAATDHPVFVGSGTRPDQVASLADASGFIVGSAFKATPDGPVDDECVRAVMDAVRALRTR